MHIVLVKERPNNSGGKITWKLKRNLLCSVRWRFTRPCNINLSVPNVSDVVSQPLDTVNWDKLRVVKPWTLEWWWSQDDAIRRRIVYVDTSMSTYVWQLICWADMLSAPQQTAITQIYSKVALNTALAVEYVEIICGMNCFQINPTPSPSMANLATVRRL